jgi:hypothetical protein
MQVKISTSLSDLTGSGLEYLLDDSGYIRAVFWNGNIDGCETIQGNSEITKGAA